MSLIVLFCWWQDVRTGFLQDKAIFCLCDGVLVSRWAYTQPKGTPQRPLVENRVPPQGPRSSTDQLYCLILKTSFTSLSLSFPFHREVSRRSVVFSFVLQINAIKFISSPGLFSSGHTSLRAVSRTFQAHTHLRTFTLSFSSQEVLPR